jgi:lipoyl(octanoyl) transferase
MTPICNVYSLGIADYARAWELQRTIADELRRGERNDTLLLVEHPSVFTTGRAGNEANLRLSPDRLAELGASFYHSDRGGDSTFHGPGQLVAYPILNLRENRRQVVWYVRTLEQVVIDTLANFGVAATTIRGRTGVWLDNRRKICAIGVRVAGGVTTHGFALNVTTDLSWFDYIVPCGLPDAVPASLREELGDNTPSMDDVKSEVTDSFARLFGYQLVPGVIADLPVRVDTFAPRDSANSPSPGAERGLGGEVLAAAGVQ